MRTIDIPSIEANARQLRAEEMWRVQGLIGQRLRIMALLLGHTLLGAIENAGELVRPLLTWNPQARTQSNRRKHLQALARLNRSARALFAWNPQAHRG
jgi:hypothetical protein